MSRLNKVIAIKLAGQPECLAGLSSDIGSNLPRLTTWVGRVVLSPGDHVLVDATARDADRWNKKNPFL